MSTHLQFFEATSQIIPVLGLVVVVEQRQTKESPASVPMAVFGLMALVLGEVASLRAVYRGTGTPYDLVLVLEAFGIATAAILTPTLIDLGKTVYAAKGQSRTWMVYGAAAVAIVVEAVVNIQHT